MIKRNHEVTKINKGIYAIRAIIGTMQRTYEIEKFPDGAWMLFWSHATGRDYINDFATKSEAVAYCSGMIDTANATVNGLMRR